LGLLEKYDKQIEIIEYLKHPPSQNSLKEILAKLGLQAEDIVRKGESLYKEQYKGKQISNSEWIRILSQNPILIERPIVIKGKKAVLGRPPENVAKLY